MFKLKQIVKYVAILTVLLAGCAYYNTMFNAQEKYKSGQKRIKEHKERMITPEIRKDFYDAIEKCWKLINIYNDSSAYADDALLLIGKSHYQVEEYTKSERYLRQFLIRYPDSDLLIEANLWLGKSLVKLDRDDEAVLYLNEVIGADQDRNMISEAYLSLGDVNYKQKSFKKSRQFFEKVIDISGDEESRGPGSVFNC